jgi:hypothetical protein
MHYCSETLDRTGIETSLGRVPEDLITLRRWPANEPYDLCPILVEG